MRGDRLKLIIHGCIDQDQKSQRELHNLLYTKLFRSGLQYHNNPELVKDSLQDGFIKIFRSIHTFRDDIVPEDKLEKVLFFWTKRIIQNTLIDKLRREKVKPSMFEIEYYKDDRFAEDDTELELHEMIEVKARLIIELIEELPPNLRKVTNKILLNGYTHKQVAEDLGISIGTSKGYLSRAKDRIREKLDKKLKRL